MAAKKEAVLEQQNHILKLKSTNKLDKDSHTDKETHTDKEIQEAVQKLDVLRDKLQKARRVALNLPQKTREQRNKVRDMKAANKAAPGSHSKEEIAVENVKLRELMCKWSKRSLVPSKHSSLSQSAQECESDDPLENLRRAFREQTKLWQAMSAEYRVGLEEGGEVGEGGGGGEGGAGGEGRKDEIDACQRKVVELREKLNRARRKIALE